MITVLVIIAIVSLSALLSGIGLPLPTTTASSDASQTVDNTPPTNTTNVTTMTGTHASDGSITGNEITNDVGSWPSGDKLWDICRAVAIAEGFNFSNTAPYNLNNPGDLSPGDENGEATQGDPQTHDGSSIIFFAVCEGGFRALRAKFNRIVIGGSHVYPVSWNWSQVAHVYAGNSQAWLTNVTTVLGVSPTSTPAQYVNGT